MSALSALASYDISDDEDVEKDSRDEDVKEDQPQEPSPDKAQEEEKKATAASHVDEEDIWRDPDDDPLVEEDKNEDEDGEDGDERNVADDSIKDVEDLSAVHEGSGEEEAEDAGGESSGDDNNEASDSLGEAIKVKAKRRSKRSSSENAMILAKKLRTSSVDEISIPPEPEGRCSSSLQDKITRFMERKVKDGEDLNRAIHARKDFRNPSIYEKLILYLSIEELGTNFPPEDYAPKIWRKAPAYDELARAQREDIAKREKERKTKVEFVTGTVKKSSSTSTSLPATSSADGGKKSKWDQQTSSKSDKPSGHKPVISAVGTVKKPKV